MIITEKQKLILLQQSKCPYCNGAPNPIKQETDPTYGKPRESWFWRCDCGKVSTRFAYPNLMGGASDWKQRVKEARQQKRKLESTPNPKPPEGRKENE